MGDWDILGLEPTQDLAAIKKAYALKLRVTRPDDDAAAYQALRGAYENAQQWAKWPTLALTETAQDIPGDAIAQTLTPFAGELPSEVAANADTADPEVLAPDFDAWIATLEACPTHDPALALVHWHSIQPRLNDIPLHLQQVASARFADLVISQALLAPDVVEALAEHFAWRSDFRAARLLGPVRSQSLLQVLDLRLAHAITDPDVLREFAPLLHFHKLRQHYDDMAALLFAMRMGEPLARMLQQPEVKRLQSLDPAPDEGLSSFWLVFWAGVARAGVLVTLMVVLLRPEPLMDGLRELTPHLPEDLFFPMAFKVVFLLGALIGLPLACLALMGLLSVIARYIGRLAEVGLAVPMHRGIGLAVFGA
ncbi:MAG TPA: hypothetical protein VGE47_03460, partial [Burkholderiaceae bacterium]